VKEVLLIHYHEIALKGKNRPFFEKKLCDNLRSALRLLKSSIQVRRLYGRILVEEVDGVDRDEVRRVVERVFGVSNFSHAWEIPSDLDRIEEVIGERLPEQEFDSFAIRARRAYKQFPLKSQQINERLGGFVCEQTGKRVDLTTPDLTIHVEILAERSLVYLGKHTGAGGLPVGVSGRMLALLSGGIDSPVAAWRMLRRGARISFVHFHSYPFTSADSQEKVLELAGVLAQWGGPLEVMMVAFGDLQREIVARTPGPLRVILYRRFMARIAARLALKKKVEALVTGESLAQVASQTLSNMASVDPVIDLPILRPLVGFDKQEIIEESKRIGTFDISIQPHDDCCSYLMPPNPATSSSHRDCQRAEEVLDIDSLVEEAVDRVESRVFDQVCARS
jgi:thiamine biosynthesis protein ThiI